MLRRSHGSESNVLKSSHSSYMHQNSLGSVPNFRQVFPIQETDIKVDDKAVAKGKLYRSSRPEHADESDLNKLEQLGIKSIIDFRSEREYTSSSKHEALDRMFKVMKVLQPRPNPYSHGSPVKFKPVYAEMESSTSKRKHYLINFYTNTYISTVFNRAPWYIKIYGLLFLVFDFILNTGFKYFVRVYAKKVFNKAGILGSYIDMIELSQHAICAAMKLLADKSNIPAMINCAHGKDRTGIITALVLSCMGKSRQYIAEEYAMSEAGLKTVQERLQKEIMERYHMTTDFITARQETMLSLLQYIEEKYDTVENYLNSIGFGTEEQERLRENLKTD